MNLYALADLHLSFTDFPNPMALSQTLEHKPMGIFGAVWENHAAKIYNNWLKVVSPEDVVAVPGDISWALNREKAVFDLYYLGLLPGTLVLIPGNHDYWWDRIGKVREMLPPNVRALQNDCLVFNRTALCGTRGWLCPNDREFTEHDEKIYRREVERLKLSLQSIPAGVDHIIVLMHYMPSNDKHERSAFIDLMVEYGVSVCVYGHLHAEAHHTRLPDEAWGIQFHLVSADFLDFTPKWIAEL